MKDDEYFMEQALLEAVQAKEKGEVPVGAVLVADQKIFSRGHNSTLEKNDPTAHAEILAIRKACDLRSNYRIPDCDLYVTLEPCAMCLGAAVQAIWCHHNHKGHRIPLSEITDSMIKTAGRTYLPDGGNAGIYAALQDRFNSLWETLSDEFKRHRNLMKSR